MLDETGQIYTRSTLLCGKLFSHPQCLMRMARFTLEAHCSLVSCLMRLPSTMLDETRQVYTRSTLLCGKLFVVFTSTMLDETRQVYTRSTLLCGKLFVVFPSTMLDETGQVYTRSTLLCGKLFSHPQCLMRLARFTLEAHCSVVSCFPIHNA